MAGFGPPPADWGDRYAAAMLAGQAEYQDVLDALAQAGYRAEFTQTGGMCAAIRIMLDGGYLLATDREDTLDWDRAKHQGWYVGLYTGEDPAEGDRYLESEQGDAATLVRLVTEILTPPARE